MVGYAIKMTTFVENLSSTNILNRIKSMIVFNNVPKGYDKPVLTVVVYHYLRGAGDSCSYSAEYKSIHTVESLKPGQTLLSDKDAWAHVKILSIGDKEIEVLWRDRKKVVVKFEDMATSGMGSDEETVWCEEYYNFKVFYDSDSSCGTIWKKFDEVREKHRQLGEEGRIMHGRDEDDVVFVIEELHGADGGKNEHSQAVEVLHKLLLTANNWWTFEMSTADVNRTGLLYDISRFYNNSEDSPEDNYLSEKDELGWRVMAWMFENNDPAKLIINRETFADRLAKAAVNGNKHAVAIFDKYAESLKKQSMADYAYLMIAYKTLIVDREDYPIIEKTIITPLPEQPVYDIKEPEHPDLGHDIGKIIARLYEIRDISKVNYAVNNIYHYGLIAAISQLEDCDSKDYLNYLATAYANMVHWMNDDEYLDKEAMKKHIKALRKDVDDVEKGKSFSSPERMYAFRMLDDVQELASTAKADRYDVEHPDPRKMLAKKWNELCMEIEELCRGGKDRDDSEVGEMMATAEAQCRELIDTYKCDEFRIHYTFLRCCDDWYSRTIVRHEEFLNEVRVVIDKYKGLSIDNKHNWFLIEQLLLDNTVEHVIPDFEVMETLIKTVIDEGDDEMKEWAEEIQKKIKEYIAANEPKRKREG